MSTNGKFPLTRWLCVGASAFASVFIFVIFMPDFPRLAPYAEPKGDISLFKASQASREDLELIELYDYSPVFLSTRFNFSDINMSLPHTDLSALAPVESPEFAIESYESDMAASRGDYSAKGILFRSYMFSDFMQNSADARMPKVKDVAYGNLRVFSADGNRPVFSERTKLKSFSGGRLWAPVDFSVIVNSDGAASMPMMISSSGLDTLDSELEDYIAENLYRMKLKKGYYTITVSP